MWCFLTNLSHGPSSLYAFRFNDHGNSVKPQAVSLLVPYPDKLPISWSLLGSADMSISKKHAKLPGCSFQSCLWCICPPTMVIGSVEEGSCSAAQTATFPPGFKLASSSSSEIDASLRESWLQELDFQRPEDAAACQPTVAQTQAWTFNSVMKPTCGPTPKHYKHTVTGCCGDKAAFLKWIATKMGLCHTHILKGLRRSGEKNKDGC